MSGVIAYCLLIVLHMYKYVYSQIQSRLPKKRLLLQRLIATAAHQLLVNKVVNTLENLLLQKADPQVIIIISYINYIN